MRRLIVTAGLALSFVAPPSWAAPLKEIKKGNMVEVTATREAKNRHVTEEFVVLKFESLHRADERVVVEIVKLLKVGAVERTCDFTEVVPVGKTIEKKLRDCSADAPDGIELALSAVTAPVNDPTPAPTPAHERTAAPEPQPA